MDEQTDTLDTPSIHALEGNYAPLNSIYPHIPIKE
jgi:hypothetical protein